MSLEMIGRLFSLVPRVAELKGIGESGYRMIVNTGPDASQTVPHIHVHVLGGCRMVHGMVRFAENGGCH
jgi:histidine triad (HIT) family protein